MIGDASQGFLQALPLQRCFKRQDVDVPLVILGLLVGVGKPSSPTSNWTLFSSGIRKINKMV